MTKYLLLYRSTVSAADQMANARRRGPDRYGRLDGLAGKAGSALTDIGSPDPASGQCREGFRVRASWAATSLMEAERPGHAQGPARRPPPA